MHQLIQSQRDFFNTNTTKSIGFRKQQLQKLYTAIKSNEQLLYDAIYKDFKKSSFDTYATELSIVYQDIIHAKKHLKSWASIKRKRTNLINFPAKSYVISEPLGVSLIIGAWNYPYQLSLAPLVSAIVSGCTAIVKPSEIPKNTSAAIAKIISENFDSNYITVVEGDVTETTELLNNKFDKIFFTGSIPVGKIIYQAAAKYLTPVTLELGGKSPAIVTEQCNLKMTAKRLVWAKFLNAGQTCISPDYLVVHQSIKKTFLEHLKKEIEKSNFSIENENYAQIINDHNFDRVLNLINKEKIYLGGNHNKENRIIEPTVLTDITFNDAIMDENTEIFGPILPVISYDKFDEVITEIKSRPKPLSCYIFTNNTKKKKKLLTEVSFGGGCVNESIMHLTNHHFGFGGVGDSGVGSYHGEEGFRTFSHYKSILEKPNWLELNLKYYPHTKTKLKIIKFIFGLK